MIGAALIPPVFIEFAFALIKKKMPGILRFINIGLAIVILSTIYSKIYALDGGPFLGFLYWPEVGWTSALSILLYIINVGVGHYYLLLAIKQGNPFQKKQLSIVMIGTFLSFLGAGTNFLLWFRIPFPPIFNILIPLYIISVAYAITTHRFMNVRLVINRIVAYSLLITIYALLSLAAIYLYSKVLPFGINSPTLFFLCILIIAGGLFFHPLRLHLQTTPDRFLFRKKYEYEQAIREFGEACQSVIDPAKLIGLFKDKNKNLIKMKAGKVYLINKGGDFKLSLFIPK
ncbi:hypothetical protein A2232_03015 [candidate division WOR-1 bacterium RIFOXYA2_FULL_46_56]|nr:MAG: hypothetical protein A2232_03015 [candidate division WOR-1 bacterium RIFOXYA2_FULL_46_56]